MGVNPQGQFSTGDVNKWLGPGHNGPDVTKKDMQTVAGWSKETFISKGGNEAQYDLIQRDFKTDAQLGKLDNINGGPKDDDTISNQDLNKYNQGNINQDDVEKGLKHISSGMPNPPQP